MGSLGRRMGALERRMGLDAAALAEAAERVVVEALTRVSDEDLEIIAGVAERVPDAGDGELARVLAEEEPEVWRRFVALCAEVAGGR